MLALVALVACSQPSAARPTARPSPSAAAEPLPACLDSPATPPAPAGVRAGLPAWVLIAGLNQPDDLLFREGVTYVGELGSGQVDAYAPGLPLMPSAWKVGTPEGIAFLGVREFVADQATDRVDEIVRDQPQTFLQLTPVDGRDGVDGIGVQGDELLVPDSPSGTLLWVDGSGHVTRSVGGFNRPTGAWPLPDGAVAVADEYGNAAVRVAADGSKSFLVQGLPIVDDVAVDAEGRVFVVTPVTSGGRLAELVAGKAVDVAGGLSAPQGLAFDGAGNLEVSESAAGRVDLFIRNFKLIPGSGTPGPRQPVCLHLVRAPGFTAPVDLTESPNVHVVRPFGVGDEAEVLVKGAGAAVEARAGALTDTLWITA